jgi:Homing endonuclease associated repeat
MDFQLETFHRDVPDEELLADLRHADEVLRAKGRPLSFRTYSAVGRFSGSTFAERFGSWNKAIAAAGFS